MLAQADVSDSTECVWGHCIEDGPYKCAPISSDISDFTRQTPHVSAVLAVDYVYGWETISVYKHKEVVE